MALFDEIVSLEMKRKMVLALEKDTQENPSRRPSIESIAFLGNEGSEKFVSKISTSFFKRLSLPDDWLHEDPTQWPQLENYAKARSLVASLAVINDRDERGMALIEA